MSLLNLFLFLLITSPVWYIFSQMFSFLTVVIVLLSIIVFSYLVGVYISYKRIKNKDKDI